MYRAMLRALLTISAIVYFNGISAAQVDDICREFGAVPTLDGPKLSSPFIYGRVIIKDLDPAGKYPRVTVILTERSQSPSWVTVSKTGNYCFRRLGAGDGSLLVEIDGIEVGRRQLASFGTAQQREDFEVYRGGAQKTTPPAVISSKFSRPPNERTIDLYKKVVESEAAKDLGRSISLVREIVSIDPEDFIAWTKLGSLHFEQNVFADADAAFRKALELRIDYTPAWINVGKMRVFQKQYAAAIEIFKQAISTDPASARSYQLLGEAYLQNKQGSLAVEALNQAIKLDPQGMAECHLLLARLYDLAGAKKEASHEFKLFLIKVPDHADKKKFEKYIKDNPE